jgi:hypothetical protein
MTGRLLLSSFNNLHFSITSLLCIYISIYIYIDKYMQTIYDYDIHKLAIVFFAYKIVIMKTFCILSFRYILDCSPSIMPFSYMRNENDDDVLYIQEFAGFRLHISLCVCSRNTRCVFFHNF